MYRYELKCKECGTTIGYMGFSHKSDDNNYVFSRTTYGDATESICCPVCEARRLKENK